ncbi:MAG TPA: HlyD family secretion protein, partial [Burkholderiaceae bacterium]|nr:HlyD family secretion protein [Burkholderiaceae bacterium]
RAPFDGVVIEGDLTQSLGAPVKRGDVLMRIAPDGQWRVIVEVDERDIEGIAIGRRGTLVLSAQPGAPIDVRVERITPVATSRDGRTFYEVETKPGPSAEPLRPGMTGIARIEAGRRAYGWIWTHRAVDAVRYAIWRFIG